MNILKITSVIFIFSLFFISVHASENCQRGIQFDGTAGSAGKISLTGPDYDIKAEYGTQAGANLFHSFENFNIHSSESAVFSGPESVNNIIARITGGNASWIDGRLCSEISGADLYLLNPAGLMFGPNASIDINGSFHVSTADYLRMGDNELFFSTPRKNEVLSIAPPSAFGFLNDKHGSISFEGRGKISEQEWEEKPSGLHVSEGRSLSLIAENIEIKNGTYYIVPKLDENGNPLPQEKELWNQEKGWHNEVVLDENGNPVPGTETIRPGDITAPQGRIHIAAVKGSAEVSIKEGSAQSYDGDITANDVWINTSGRGGGDIYIQGGNFKMKNSVIQADTEGDLDGKNIDVQVNNLKMTEGSCFTAYNYSSGKGGTINIKVPGTIEINGEEGEGRKSGIFARSRSKDADAGASGDIIIQAGELHLKEGAGISASTYGPGNSGNVEIKADKSLSMSGQASAGVGSFITSNSDYYYGVYIEDAGSGGTIDIEARDMSLSDGARIRAATWGSGDSGNINIKVSDLLKISGESTVPEPNGHVASFISVNAESAYNISGNGGNLEINTGRLELSEGAWIGSTSTGAGQGGNINIKAEDKIRLSGMDSAGFYSGIFANSTSEADNSGDAGKINIKVGNSASLFENTSLSSESRGAGGGEISLSSGNKLYLFKSQISSSVKQGRGNGGDIRSDSKSVILNHGSITANAEKGDGGAIFIESDIFIKSADSNISAASKRGNDGSVKIEAPDMDIAAGLTILPASFLNAENMEETPCSARTDKDVSRFIMKGRDGACNVHDDWKTVTPNLIRSFPSSSLGTHSGKLFLP